MANNPRTRSELLARRMEMTILHDRLVAGDPLGTITSWAEKTGYSVPTVREAVRITTERGTIIARPGRNGGLFVAESEPVLAAAKGLAEVHRLLSSSVEDVRMVLRALDPLIAAEAAIWRTDGNVDELMVAVDEVETAETPEAFQRAADALLERISQITPNNWLTVTYLSQATLAQRLEESVVPRQATIDPRSGTQRYRGLVRAIAAGDPTTATAIATTLRRPPAKRGRA